MDADVDNTFTEAAGGLAVASRGDYDLSVLDTEFLRPLVSAWSAKAQAGLRYREKWDEIRRECLMFYSQSAAAMWNTEYSRKFWQGVKLPRFRITINKAFELVAVFGPNLMWELPFRTVKPKRPLSEDVNRYLQTMLQDPNAQQAFGPILQMQQVTENNSGLTAALMQSWLNYTPREQPGGGLAGHSERAIVDALLCGRGVLQAKPYYMPGSQRLLTGSFYESPANIIVDPDYDSVDEAKWMIVKHTEPYWQVEERFKLPRNSLKNRASLESSWNRGELQTDTLSSAYRRANQTNDLMVWYEAYSKGGVGIRNTSVDTPIRDHLDRLVGKFAYIAFAPDVPYPLNCPTESLRKGMTDEQVRQTFKWPIEAFERDNRWPVEFCDFYIDPECSWPISPLAPGLGELKLLNFLVSWLANRTWTSSRDFWAVAAPHIETYKAHLESGDDQTVIPTPYGVDDVRKAVQIISQPETRQDIAKLIEFISQMFAMRTGLTPFAYGLNADGTQNRTAEETAAKSRAVSARPEYMAKQVAGWQGRVAQAEAMIARTFVQPQDVAAYMGPMGGVLWQQYVQSVDMELIARQFDCTIEASSIRRPNRDRDIANMQQVMGLVMPILTQYGQMTGNYEPYNALIKKWGEYHDEDLTETLIPPQQPDPVAEQAKQLQVQQLAADVQKTQADAQKTQAEAAASMQQGQVEAVKAQMDMQMLQAKAQMDMMKAQIDMQAKTHQLELQGRKTEMELVKKQFEMDMAKAMGEMKILQDREKFQQDLTQDQQKHDQEMEQSAQAGYQQMQITGAQAEQQRQAAEAQGQVKIEQSKEQGKVKLEQAKQQAKAKAQQAKAKPKPKPKK